MFCCWTPSRLRRSSELNSCWKLIKFLVPDESVKHWVKERYLTVDWIVRDSFKKCSHWILIALISGAFQFFEATSFHRRLLISDWRILRYTQASNEETLTSCERDGRRVWCDWISPVWVFEHMKACLCSCVTRAAGQKQPQQTSCTQPADVSLVHRYVSCRGADQSVTWIWASFWCQLSLKQTVSVNSSCFILIGLGPDGFLCHCQTQTSGFIPEWPHHAPEEQVHDGKPRDGFITVSI